MASIKKDYPDLQISQTKAHLLVTFETCVLCPCPPFDSVTPPRPSASQSVLGRGIAWGCVRRLQRSEQCRPLWAEGEPSGPVGYPLPFPCALPMAVALGLQSSGAWWARWAVPHCVSWCRAPLVLRTCSVRRHCSRRGCCGAVVVWGCRALGLSRAEGGPGGLDVDG